MADELKFPGNTSGSIDEPLVSLIREAYSAPPGDEYWAALEARIMSRIACCHRHAMVERARSMGASRTHCSHRAVRARRCNR
jgi:hypothetical protein